MTNPQRDVRNYDQKPSVQLSTSGLSALHARIGLSSSFPLSTLGRCLTDPSMERNHELHNEALSVVGSGLLEYYISEYLCVRWPRLPMKTQLAALWAYTGESALARIAREWGVQSDTVPKLEKKEKPHQYDSSPTLLVNTSKTDAGKLDHELEINMEWEIREQARLGWLEPRGNPQRRKGFLNTIDDKEYEKRFKLFALQQFVQSVVGGVYVHMVYRVTKYANMRVLMPLKHLSKHISYPEPSHPYQHCIYQLNPPGKSLVFASDSKFHFQ